MTIQEKIRKVIDDYTDDVCLYLDKDCELRKGRYCVEDEGAYKCLMKRLDELGVVIKVEGELPKLPPTPPISMESRSISYPYVKGLTDERKIMLKWHNDSLEPLIKGG